MSQQTTWVPTSVDLEKPSAARSYDYLLGGNHNFQVDREFIEMLLKAQPEIKRFAIMNRAFMRRVVLFMVERGIRQFLDLGSGIPTVGNVHEIAQQADPTARVVYVDNEHVAVAHSQLILEHNENAAMVQADITRPRVVLNHPDTRRLLDFSQPVGLLAITIGHYMLPDSDPVAVFESYRDALAPGSYLALTHLTADFDEDMGAEVTEKMKQTQNTVVTRTRAEVMEFFGDFELVEPGLVTTSQWRPESPPNTPREDGLWAGVARKS